jgi:uncharacterized protein YndB with AHSA1/START domain
MKRGTTGAAMMHVNAPPELVYELVSDVTRMGEWSPETVRCRWLRGATGPAVGARFKGTNRRGFTRWSTKSRVLAAEPGREFAFVASVLLFRREMTKWRYQFEPAVDGGTNVTESFEMVDDVPRYISFVERSLMNIQDRRADLEVGMQHTLERVKGVAERRI